jgi:protein phosphatase PTC7
LAKVLTEEAFEKSNDKNYFSPFAKKAQDNKRYYLGGKPDDITIIVAQVTLTSNENTCSENTSTTDHDKQEDYYIV